MDSIFTLLEGAVDMHVHAYPDVSLQHLQHESNEAVVTSCREAGMTGLVLKTHGWPAPGLARMLDGLYDDFSVFPSVTLNACSGGPHPWVVEMAVHMGARMIWLPTWSAWNDHQSGRGFGVIAASYLPRTKTDWKEQDFYRLLDEEGQLKEEIKECIALCRDAHLVLGTGHISSEESMAVGRFADSIGYHKVCLTHPRSDCAKNSFEAIRAFAEMGQYVEMCALNVAPLHTSMTIADMKKIIDAAGADHCFLSTDHFFDWVPPIPIQLYEVLGCLREAGVSYDTLREYMKTPRRLLELE